MKYAIIAAGQGSRLKQEGVMEEKPLVRLCGEAMLDRLIRIFCEQGASEIVLIVNAEMPQVVAHAVKLEQESKEKHCPLHVVVKSTPSSMHSFYEISPFLENEPFCLTTVDTIFREEDFKTYIKAFEQSTDDGMMAVTDYIDDEKPLYVGTDKEMNITGFFDARENCQYISGGIYCLKPNALNTLYKCVSEGKSRMRNFQRELVNDGLKLKAFAFPKILDVDHAEDIKKAETFLRN